MEKSEFRVANKYHYVNTSHTRWILSHLGRFPYLPLIAVGSEVIASVASGYIQFLVGDGFDITRSSSIQSSYILNIVMKVIICAVIEGIFTFFKDSSLQITGETMERNIKEEYFTSLLGKNQTFFAQNSSGDLLAHATNDVMAINTMFSSGILLILEAILGIVTPIIMIGVLYKELLLVPCIYLVIWIIIVYQYNKKLYDVSGALNYEYGNMNGIATETVYNMELVKGFVQEKREFKRFFKQAELYKNLFVKQGKIEGTFMPNLVYTICLAFGFLHSILLWQADNITIGQLVTFMGLFATFEVANSLSSYSFVLVQMGMAGAKRILDTMKFETVLDENKEGYKGQMKGDICFDNVSFGFNDTNILENISFNIPNCSLIGIVGKTGSGKTILTQLINRIFDVTTGSVSVDGIDVREWNLEALRNQIAYIEQNVFLFSKSVADNIRFSKPNATDEEVMEAARMAQADEFIQMLPNKYNTVLDENGSNLSGGQKQRIAIARALLTDAKIIILDAFTSAIDSLTEDKIYNTIQNICSQRTVIIITNKISKIESSEKILVLSHGKLIGQGKHEELLQTCGEYKKIFYYNKID